MANKNGSTLARALSYYGREHQLRKLQEECAELIMAVNKYLEVSEPSQNRVYNLHEEVVDVEILLKQLKPAMDGKLMAKIRRFKTKRLAKRILK